MHKKSIIIAVLLAIIAILVCSIVNIKKAYSLREYSIQNDCTWTWNGTIYGDDRDYICK